MRTRRKVLKVAKMKDANYGCKDEGNEVSHQSVISQSSVSHPSVIITLIFATVISIFHFRDF